MTEFPGWDIIIGQLIFGDIAQLGERCVRNAEVTGSNPAISIKAIMISLELIIMAFLFAATAKREKAGPGIAREGAAPHEMSKYILMNTEML